MRSFIVAKNPDPKSRLSYLIRLPVGGEEPIVLACRETWPGPKDVFCYQLDRWPPDAEVLEEIPVQSCWRRGKAVHLVLKRRTRRRSMFVWTQSKGRTLIFWRTQKTMSGARPGLKVPQARGLERNLQISVDVRERYAWRFSRQDAECVKRELPIGDYGIVVEGRLQAAIERKSVSNLANSAVDGTLSFVLAELSRIPHGAVVVEGRLSDVIKVSAEHVQTGWLLNAIAALQVTYPRVNWIFAETRDLAEDYAFRWLAAAKKATSDPGSPLYEPPKARTAQKGGGGAGQVRERPVPFGGDGSPTGPGQGSSQDSRQGSPQDLHQGSTQDSHEASPKGSLQSSPHTSHEAFPLGLPVHDRRGRLDEALRLADEGRIWTTREYAEHFNVNRQTARNDLLMLVEAGALAKEGSNRNRRYVRTAKTDPSSSL